MAAPPADESLWQWILGGAATLFIGLLGLTFRHLSDRISRVEIQADDRARKVADDADAGDDKIWREINEVKRMIADNRAHGDQRHAELLIRQGDMQSALVTAIHDAVRGAKP